MDIDSVVLKKIEDDTEFQATLADLSDGDKETAIASKKSELIKSEFEALDKKARENEQKFKDQQIRAAKAEEEAKKGKPNVENPPKEALSLKDIRALNSVHDEDVDFVTNWAKSNNIEIAEAVKNPDVQLVLKGHEEFRKVAEANNTGTSKRSNSKVPDDVLLSNASKGILPDNDEDLIRLFNLRKGKK